ncbi:hypothetical protein ABZY57_04795 [Streptomyces sp. NPDC006450]|uniref:hypothetical protein n=1 Tax=Streptomyces sp. NPDC006450 TaxID=3155458 RepID=UPI0033B88CB9
MPRRRPGALRAERGTYEDRRPPAWAWELPPVDGLSPDAAAAHWARPGQADEIAELLGRYRAFLSRPGGSLLLVPSECPACPGCARDDVAVVRDDLGDLYRGLPPVARAALGRALRGLDAQFRRRTLPHPVPSPGGWVDWSGRPRAWWHRRRYEDD